MSAMKTKGSRSCGKMFSLVMATALSSVGGRFAAAFWFLQTSGWRKDAGLVLKIFSARFSKRWVLSRRGWHS